MTLLRLLHLLDDLLLLAVLLVPQLAVLLHDIPALLSAPHLIIELLLLNRLLFQLLQNQVLPLLDLQIVLKVGLFHNHLASPN